MLSPRRSRLDATYVEIMLYLNLNLDVIPKYIPEIQVKDAFRHLPARLSANDSLDQSIVDNEDQPLFCDGVGDGHVKMSLLSTCCIYCSSVRGGWVMLL